MPTPAPSIPRPTHATPDHHDMVRRIGLAETVRIMKGDPNPLPLILLVAVAMITTIFAVISSIEPARAWFEESLRTLGWMGAFFSGGGM